METKNSRNAVSTWGDIRRLADELELEIHLAGMDARDRWHTIEPRLVAFERRMKAGGERAGKAVARELEAIWDALRGLDDDVERGK